MKPAAAKRLAFARGIDLWWDRYLQVWTLTVFVDPDANKPAEHCSAGALRHLSPQQFTQVYLTRDDAVPPPSNA